MPLDGTVLVVDDDRDLRQVLEMYLQLQGYSVMTATDGEDALAKVAEEMPAVILLDMRMPVLDGWGFAAEFRQRYERRVPIIVMTAAADARQRALEIEADAFLSKPFEPEDLLRELERVSSAPRP